MNIIITVCFSDLALLAGSRSISAIHRSRSQSGQLCSVSGSAGGKRKVSTAAWRHLASVARDTTHPGTEHTLESPWGGMTSVNTSHL